jgi:hypothetical protein
LDLKADLLTLFSIREEDLPVIYMRDSGSVKITIDKTGWKLHTMDGQKFTGPSNMK